MAFKINVTLLLDVDSENEAQDATNEILREQTRTWEADSCLVDYCLGDVVVAGPISADYDEGEAFVSKQKLSAQQREVMVERLYLSIDFAMTQDKDMREEAIIEGRIGLDEMSDEELIDFARDCWDLTVEDLGVAE
jgi:hypothetical protein